ncbi:MAG: DUF1801 domain-containing protein [Clostridiales bacterium]|nr:DUF1801 domain-containing protein [Clostridiales bacterium]
MNDEIKCYLKKYPQEIVNLYMELREIIYSVNAANIEEKMWAKLPSYYDEEKYIRLIPFKDHINIETTGLADYMEAFAGYKFTPKGMLQISSKQNIPRDILMNAFKNTFLN